MENLKIKKIFTILFFLFVGGCLLTWHLPPVKSQTNPLTYPEIITALNTKVPNSAFNNKDALINFLIAQIKTRKVEKALSAELEAILRQSGATAELIQTIKTNTPTQSNSTQSPSYNAVYSEMPEGKKRQFIETKVNEFLDRFGRTDADKISSQGIDLIKASVDSYIRRLSVNENTPGNGGGMKGNNSCDFGKGNLTTVLKRGGIYLSDIKESFQTIGVQPEIGTYIAFLETEFCPCLQSPTGPLGMFQLTKSMAEMNGLKAVAGATPNNPDERCNPKTASKAAALYLKKLIDQLYGKDVNGLLFSVAAYNSGEGAMNRNIRILRESGKNNVSFWDLVANKDKLIQQFQAENYQYVPKFLAAAIIGENPKSFGLAEFQPLMPFSKNDRKQTQTASANTDESEFWKTQRNKALEPRNAPVGIEIEGLIIPEVLLDGPAKQTKFLGEMKQKGFTLPMDYFDLAEKNLNGELVAVPLVTETYLSEIGGSAPDSPFTKFSFKDGSKILPANSPENKQLKQFADNFSGQKFDLNNPGDRRQTRIGLLRMLQPKAKVVLEEIAQNYYEKFGRPLRLTSLVRSMEYQIDLNKFNANSFLIRGEDSLPPHCSGLAFDLAYKHLTAEEQNFIMEMMAQMEGDGKIDGMREGGANAAFHIFVF